MFKKPKAKSASKISTNKITSTKKSPLLIRSKQLSPRKQSKYITDSKCIRTNVDSPIAGKINKQAKSIGPGQSQKKMQTIKITEIVKVSHSKEKHKTLRDTNIGKYMKITELLVSPIQKIHIEFVNNEDKSLLTALETIN